MSSDSALAAAIALARPQVATPEHFGASLSGLSASLVELPHLELATLALDLSLLLSGERLLPFSQDVGPELSTALRGYEDHLLARLVSDRRWLHLQEAWLAAPATARPAAAGLLVERLMRHLRVPQSGSSSQAAVRRIASRSPQEVVDEGLVELTADPELVARISAQLTQLAKAARRERTLLSDADVFLLQNVTTLEGLGPRVAMAQLADAAQALEEYVPVRMKATSQGAGDAPTALEEESALPVGGWSSLTNSGSPESMVTSELVYMEDGDRPDLFDVRFVEGELLYYARDESVALRKRRTLTVVLDASLDSARLIDDGEKHQRLVWSLAAVTAVVRRLSTWLSHEALTFELVFIRGKSRHPLVAEQAVVALLLREWQERGRLQLSEDDSLDAVIERVSADQGPRADVVVMTAAEVVVPPSRLRRVAVVRADLAPQLQLGTQATTFTTSPAARQWGELTKALLSALLS